MLIEQADSEVEEEEEEDDEDEAAPSDAACRIGARKWLNEQT